MHEHRLKYLHHLRGKGLEIGALNNPLPLPPGATAEYSDIMTPEEIDRNYPGSKHPNFVSNGEVFSGIEDDRFDFVVANHVLEHVTDPIRALKEWHRILKENGILFLAIPDKRYTFDSGRKRTSLLHLVEDYRSQLPDHDRNLIHLTDWGIHVEKLKQGTPEWKAWIDGQIRNGYSVHNHVWIIADILKVLKYIGTREGIHYSIVNYNNTPRGSNEFVLILKRRRHLTSIERFLEALRFLKIRVQVLISDFAIQIPRQVARKLKSLT